EDKIHRMALGFASTLVDMTQKTLNSKQCKNHLDMKYDDLVEVFSTAIGQDRSDQGFHSLGIGISNTGEVYLMKDDKVFKKGKQASHLLHRDISKLNSESTDIQLIAKINKKSHRFSKAFTHGNVGTGAVSGDPSLEGSIQEAMKANQKFLDKQIQKEKDDMKAADEKAQGIDPKAKDAALHGEVERKEDFEAHVDRFGGVGGDGGEDDGVGEFEDSF
ncbi:hypothetical protein SCG7109_AC_00010, partial [Chlamydiales bacterium SCGC AG-110-M15]